MLYDYVQLAVAAGFVLAGLAQADVQGFDISDYQPKVDYKAAYSSGARFVIIKVRYCRGSLDPLTGSHLTVTH